MNIFAINQDPEIAARQLGNKHIVKMPTESLQMLCFCFPEGTAPYKNSPKHAHYKHPASIWLRCSKDNFEWGLAHFEAQLDEYKIRYKREHGTAQHLDWIKNHYKSISFSSSGLTQFARCFGKFKEQLEKEEPDCVKAYQKFYILDKIEFALWPKISKIPDFWVEKSERFVDKSFVNGVYSKR
jgi:hypothetical protein